MILAENRDPVWAEQLAAASRLKASTRYKILLDRFMDEQELHMLPDRDFTMLDEVLMTRTSWCACSPWNIGAGR
jgi:hypothetical protein